MTNYSLVNCYRCTSSRQTIRAKSARLTQASDCLLQCPHVVIYGITPVLLTAEGRNYSEKGEKDEQFAFFIPNRSFELPGRSADRHRQPRARKEKEERQVTQGNKRPSPVRQKHFSFLTLFFHFSFFIFHFFSNFAHGNKKKNGKHEGPAQGNLQRRKSLTDTTYHKQ